MKKKLITILFLFGLLATSWALLAVDPSGANTGGIANVPSKVVQTLAVSCFYLRVKA